MTCEKLNAVPLVEIDEGIFKYVLIKVYSSGKTELSKDIVRGFSAAEWHSDIYDRVSSSLSALGLATECLGGGRIEHNSSLKLIKVYGYSQGFGKADHAISRDIIKTKYKDYKIEISDDGY